MAKRLAIAKKLKSESVNELLAFTNLPREARELHVFAVMLEMHDSLLQTESKWTPLDDALIKASLKEPRKDSEVAGTNGGTENEPGERQADRLEAQDQSQSHGNQGDPGVKSKKYPGQNIYVLADAMLRLGQKGKTATVQHWGRFAIMRAVYLEDSGPNFWDNVDLYKNPPLL
ncbi:hypothetical protein BC834DRAFT_971365 [Gloeopeniophorella convolvens]|nr:hypothetical protein BC834DRAFT_971365 [Gloeopeniophorella convolvens]